MYLVVARVTILLRILSEFLESGAFVVCYSATQNGAGQPVLLLYDVIYNNHSRHVHTVNDEYTISTRMRACANLVQTTLERAKRI